MLSSKKKKTEKEMHFRVKLTGNAKTLVENFRKEWEEKFGKNSLMGKGRIVQILLCELHQKKVLKEGIKEFIKG